MRLRYFLAAVAVFSASQASAAVLGFEGGNGLCDVTQAQSFDGFSTVSDNTYSGGTPGAGCFGFLNSDGAKSGDKWGVNFNSRIGHVIKDVGTITVNSIWVRGDDRVGATTVKFLGLDALYGNVLHTINVDITNVWQQVFFAGWDNVKVFGWDSAVPDVSNISVDDMVYDEANVVPVSAALPLLLTAFGGLFGIRRLRRKA